MCIVANKGFYYVPHFVKDIAGSAEDDTVLSRFFIKNIRPYLIFQKRTCGGRSKRDAGRDRDQDG